MKTLGIIVEYNPFHNGHLYQIQSAKKITGADYVVVVMSGNFVQRGTPAIINKYNRTKMCLDNGVDLVIELPVCYSCASAEFFAFGAVSLLEKLGIIDFLCFGSENDNLDILNYIAELLISEPKEYKNYLQAYLKKGLSFPVSRQKAICDYLSHHQNDTIPLDEFEHLLNSPNNILAIEYLKALKQMKSNIIPICIKRVGSGYHTQSLTTVFSSATAIRNHITQHSELSNLKEQVPLTVFQNIMSHLDSQCPIVENDFSILLGNKLLSLNKDDYTKYFDLTEELAHRIHNNKYDYQNFTQFSLLLKRKDITLSRINRALLHMILEIKTDDIQFYLKHGTVFYFRILGFHKPSAILLKQIKEKSKLPLIVKLAGAEELLERAGLSMLRNNIYADNLYRFITMNKYNITLPNEYTQGLIINS